MIRSTPGYLSASLGFLLIVYIARTHWFPRYQIGLGLVGLAIVAWRTSQGSLQGEAAERNTLILIGAASLYILVRGLRLARHGHHGALV